MQVPGQDFTETMSPIACLASYHAILSLAAKLVLEMHHLDIKTAFLNGSLDEEIYMKAPDGFNGGSGVWRLRKSLYRLKQVSHVWNKLLNGTLKKLGFNHCEKDTCMYLYQSKGVFTILAVHIDNMLITSNSTQKLIELKDRLAEHFRIKDLGEVNFLLGIEVTYNRKAGMIELLQQAYIEQLLKRFNLQDARPTTTPLSSGVWLTQDNCPSTNEGREDMTNILYASLIGALMYAAIGTRPNITFAVGALSCFLSNPGRCHWNEAKHTLCYLKGTANHTICYSSNTSLVGRIISYSHSVGMKPTKSIKGFCDLGWAGCVDTRRLTSGFIWMMGGGVICWRSKLQSIIVLSSMEAEYVGTTPVVQEIIWLRDLLCELNIIDDSPLVLNMDNQGAVYLT